MKEFSPLQAPFFTFFSKPFYRDLLLNGKGIGFVYLFLLLLFCWTLQTIKVFTLVQTGVNDKIVAEFVNQVPAMNVQNGKLSIDKPSPYLLGKDPDTGKPLIVFDTTGKITDLSQTDGAPILLTQDSFMVKEKDGSQKSVPWSQMKTDFSVSSTSINEILGKLPLWVAAGAWAVGIFVWVAHILQALLFGAFAMLMDSRKLGYQSMVRLASFAMTPSIVLSLIQFLVGKDVPAFGLISLAITMGYIYFGNQSARGDEPPLV